MLNIDQILSKLIIDILLQFIQNVLLKKIIWIIQLDLKQREKNKSKKIEKKVEFNKNVNVINIQSYKKEMRKDYQDINKDYLDEDFSACNRIKCFECNIF